VRKALGVVPGDELAYVIEGDRAVISKAAVTNEEHDPSLAAFLDLLSRDLSAHPDRLRGLPATLVERIRDAVAGVEVDLDEPIEGPVVLSR
jgi:antitoxin PrlF